MNIFNILRRKLGLVTVPELQRVITATVNNVVEQATYTPPYKSLVGLISQQSTNTPFFHAVFENTIGNITLARFGVGVYAVTLPETVSRDKFYATIQYSVFDTEVRYVIVKEPTSTFNTFNILCYAEDPVSGVHTLVDNMSRAKLEIRIYP